jgi:hypothetical protein
MNSVTISGYFEILLKTHPESFRDGQAGMTQYGYTIGLLIKPQHFLNLAAELYCSHVQIKCGMLMIEQQKD